MTTNEVRERLENGETLSNMFEFIPGQECEIFKGEWNPSDDVIYIPDIYLNEIPINRPLSHCNSDGIDEINEVLGNLYTGKDFVDLANGDEDIAERLFIYCDWQNPSSAIDEMLEDVEDLKTEKYVKEVINKIKLNISNSLNTNIYTDDKLYHDLYDLYDHYNSCIVTRNVENLANELIDDMKYEEAARILKQFQIVSDTFSIF